jgi:hypothetical protein
MMPRNIRALSKNLKKFCTFAIWQVIPDPDGGNRHRQTKIGMFSMINYDN